MNIDRVLYPLCGRAVLPAPLPADQPPLLFGDPVKSSLDVFLYFQSWILRKTTIGPVISEMLFQGQENIFHLEESPIFDRR